MARSGSTRVEAERERAAVRTSSCRPTTASSVAQPAAPGAALASLQRSAGNRALVSLLDAGPVPTPSNSVQRRLFGGKGKGAKTTKDQAPKTPLTKQGLEGLLGTSAPAGAEEAATRMAELRTFLKDVPADERGAIFKDHKLMKKARTYVGNHEYMSFVTAVGTHRGHTSKSASGEDHLSGAEADTFIRTEIGKHSHLKPYLTKAVKAGKQAEGFVAVVGAKDWDRIYATQYPDEAIGSDDEQLTNAFIANQHSDRPAIVHRDRGTRSTVIHESMHRYSELALLREFGFRLNEGATEYFTRLIADRHGRPVGEGGTCRDNYDDNYNFVKDSLLPMLASGTKAQEKALAEVYFAGKVGVLKNAYAKLDKKKDRKATPDALQADYTALMADVSAGKWTDAAAKLTALAP